jgi:nicotinamide riboside kinase
MRIAITGPESSGKTTLSEKLALKYKADLVAEYARNYLLERNGKYTQKDLDSIAIAQVKSWEDSNNKLLFCDTEITVIKIWSEFKYKSCSETILNLHIQQKFDHYFLCFPDIPWEEDPLRENPNDRESLFDIYLNELKKKKLPFTILKGNIENRIKTCEEVIERLSLRHL